MDDLSAKDHGSGGGKNEGRRGSSDMRALPYTKAFVVQFSAETDRRLEHATGRIEHLETGRRVPFASVAELFACMVVLLTDVDPAKQGGTTDRRRRSRGGARKATPSLEGPPAS